MQSFSATRMELLARVGQIVLARQGRDLLEQKRTALMKEFLHIADAVMQGESALQDAAIHARYALSRAETFAGTETVYSASLASSDELPLEVEMTSIVGVEVLHIEQKRVSRSALGRGYSVTSTSTTIDETAAAFEHEVEAIIQLAENELRFTRLADEIQQTSRRLNALDHVLIPRLEAECNYIQMVLEERERSDNFRLRLAKRLLVRRKQSLEDDTVSLWSFTAQHGYLLLLQDW